MAIRLYLLYFVKVLFESLARVGCIVPAFCLVNDCHNSLVLYDNANVNRVVQMTENSALVRISYIDILQKLQPEGLQLICVVFEKIKVVAYG